jgi:hypothetical protein
MCSLRLVDGRFGQWGACTQLTLLVCLLTWAGGCLHVNQRSKPASIDGGQTGYSAKKFRDDYATYTKDVTEHHDDDARQQRDSMISLVEVDIESDYRAYVANLSTARAAIATVGDVTELGLSAAIGVVSGSDVKDLLAASLTGFKGSRFSFYKNFFREKTTEVLISQMEASREEVRAKIIVKTSSLSVKQYPFEEAWRDLVELFYAGTLDSALVQLSSKTGSDAAAQKKKANDLDIKRANSADEAQAAIRIRSNYARLFQDATSGDANKSASAVKTAKETLTTIGSAAQLSDQSTPAEVMTALRDEIRKALSDPSLIPQLDKLLTPQQ